MPATVKPGLQRLDDTRGQRDRTGLVIELQRDAVAFDEAGGELVSGELLKLDNAVADGGFVEVGEGPLPQHGAADVEHLEEVEEGIAQVAFVVKGHDVGSVVHGLLDQLVTRAGVMIDCNVNLT